MVALTSGLNFGRDSRVVADGNRPRDISNSKTLPFAGLTPLSVFQPKKSLIRPEKGTITEPLLEQFLALNTCAKSYNCGFLKSRENWRWQIGTRSTPSLAYGKCRQGISVFLVFIRG
jgi:hypothetical protein